MVLLVSQHGIKDCWKHVVEKLKLKNRKDAIIEFIKTDISKLQVDTKIVQMEKEVTSKVQDLGDVAIYN